jgi:positive regulator of sigma E activity
MSLSAALIVYMLLLLLLYVSYWHEDYIMVSQQVIITQL